MAVDVPGLAPFTTKLSSVENSKAPSVRPSNFKYIYYTY